MTDEDRDAKKRWTDTHPNGRFCPYCDVGKTEPDKENPDRIIITIRCYRPPIISINGTITI